MAKKIGKLNMRGAAKNLVVVAATGAAAQVLQGAVLPENPETMDYIMIGAGLVLPEVIKDPMAATAGTALLAIGAYRMAERYDLAGKIGIGQDAVTTPATSGWKDANAVGKTWNPKPAKQAKTASGGSTNLQAD